MAEHVIKAEHLKRTYGTEEATVHALNDVDIRIDRGEFLAIVGPSGSGKSTLLNILSGLDQSTQGDVWLNGTNIEQMSSKELTSFRRDHIGLIFQSYNLIPVLTVMENVEYVMLLQGIHSNERKKRVMDILKRVGLEGKENRYPAHLSGGQQQRVAVARAMVSHPSIIMADEPTANLDSKTGSDLLDMMRDLNEKEGMTFLFSTHDEMIMKRAKRLVVLKDGKIVSDSTQ